MHAVHQLSSSKLPPNNVTQINLQDSYQVRNKYSMSKSISSFGNASQSTGNKSRKTVEDFTFMEESEKKSILGEGSYGTVRLAIDKATGIKYAIKIMQKSKIFQNCTIENLKREVKIQKRMKHPNICTLFDYFEDRQNVYLVLEYAEQGSLFQNLRRAKRFSEDISFRLFYQTCLGIDHIHKNDIIHRDIKPENLLIDKNGDVKLCDFGWSAEQRGPNIDLTTFCGTIDYMPPEMIKSNSSHDHRVDIWGLGVLLYELTHGYAPFNGPDDKSKLRNISSQQPITFESFASSDLKDLILRILKHDPIQRISMQGIFAHPWMTRFYSKFHINIQSILQQQNKNIYSKMNRQMSNSANNINNTTNNNYNNTTTKIQAPTFSSRSLIERDSLFSNNSRQNTTNQPSSQASLGSFQSSTSLQMHPTSVSLTDKQLSHYIGSNSKLSSSNLIYQSISEQQFHQKQASQQYQQVDDDVPKRSMNSNAQTSPHVPLVANTKNIQSSQQNQVQYQQPTQNLFSSQNFQYSPVTAAAAVATAAPPSLSSSIHYQPLNNKVNANLNSRTKNLNNSNVAFQDHYQIQKQTEYQQYQQQSHYPQYLNLKQSYDQKMGNQEENSNSKNKNRLNSILNLPAKPTTIIHPQQIQNSFTLHQQANQNPKRQIDLELIKRSSHVSMEQQILSNRQKQPADNTFLDRLLVSIGCVTRDKK